MIFTNQTPWYMAQFRKALIAALTWPIQTSTEYINTWVEVKYPSGHK